MPPPPYIQPSVSYEDAIKTDIEQALAISNTMLPPSTTRKGLRAEKTNVKTTPVGRPHVPNAEQSLIFGKETTESSLEAASEHSTEEKANLGSVRAGRGDGDAAEVCRRSSEPEECYEGVAEHWWRGILQTDAKKWRAQRSKIKEDRKTYLDRAGR
jgi:hypothetical protein